MPEERLARTRAAYARALFVVACEIRGDFSGFTTLSVQASDGRKLSKVFRSEAAAELNVLYHRALTLMETKASAYAFLCDISA